MANYILKETTNRGYGVFAAKDIQQDEHLFHVDLNSFKRYSLAELERLVDENSAINGDHANYVGGGKYVIEDTPAAYMNHSCDPNCYFKMKSIAVYDVYALRDLVEGEEKYYPCLPPSIKRKYKDRFRWLKK
jgi:SET domain-containing protein